MSKKTGLYAVLLAAFIMAGVLGQSTTQNKRIRDLDPTTADLIEDDDAVLFGVDKTDSDNSFRLSLAELKKTQPQVRNVKQYGAEGDGVTDDTGAIRLAVAATPSGGTLYFPEGQYIMGNVDISKPINIYGPGVIVVPVNNYGFNIQLDSYWSDENDVSAFGTYQLTAESTQTVTQATVTGHPFEVGDIVKFLGDTVFGGSYWGEFARVIKVPDANTIVLDHTLHPTLIASSNVSVRKAPDGRVVLDLNFDWAEGGAATDREAEGSNDGPLVFLSGAVDASIKITSLNSYSTIFHGRSLYQGSIEVNAGNIDNARESSNQYNVTTYGVLLDGACFATKVYGATNGGTYGVSTSIAAISGGYNESITTMVKAGGCRNVLVSDFTVTGATTISYQCHGTSFDTYFLNCAAFNMASLDETAVLGSTNSGIGFVLSGGGCTLTNCTVDGAGVGYSLQDSGASYTLTNPTTLVGCVDRHCTGYGIIVTNAETLTTVIDNHVSTSPCTALYNVSGRCSYKSSTISNRSDIDVSPIILEGYTKTQISNLTVLCGTGAEPTIQVNDSCEVLLREVILDRVVDVNPAALFLVVTGTALVNIDSTTFLGWEYVAGEADGVAYFPAEGLLSSSSSGSLSLEGNMWAGYGKRFEYGTAAPASELHAVGDIVWHTTPAAGGNIGWVCTAGGTPGTWKTFGSIAP